MIGRGDRETPANAALHLEVGVPARRKERAAGVATHVPGPFVAGPEPGGMGGNREGCDATRPEHTARLLQSSHVVVDVLDHLAEDD